MKIFGMISVFAAAALLSGFSKSQPRPAPSPIPLVSVSPIPQVSSLPTQGVTFSPVEGYSTPEQRIKIKRAGALAYTVIHSQCFDDFMSKRKLIQTNGRPPSEVPAHLRSLTGDVPVKMYYRCMRSWRCPTGTTAVAYRQPPSMEINLNSAVFTSELSDCEWASTLGHESFGHSLGGYDHDFDWNPQRSFSVPYSIGGADESQGGDAFKACCHVTQ